MARRLFEFMEEDDSIPGERLILNVYDLSHMNGYLYWAGLGVYHSAIEAYGTEYAYGAHDYPTSGVFEVEPRRCPGFKFRKSLTVGTIWMSAERFREFIEEIACEYSGDSYNLIYKNCNHFCDDICMRLVGSPLPNWVNRLAKLGSLCSCLLPRSLQSDEFSALDFKAHNDEDDDSDDAKCAQNTFHQHGDDLPPVILKRRHVITSAFIRGSFTDAVFPLD